MFGTSPSLSESEEELELTSLPLLLSLPLPLRLYKIDEILQFIEFDGPFQIIRA